MVCDTGVTRRAGRAHPALMALRPRACGAEPGSWGRPPGPDPATSLSNGRASGSRVTSCGAAARTRWRRLASRCGWSEVRRPRGPGAARPGAGGAPPALPRPCGPRGLLSGLNSLPRVSRRRARFAKCPLVAVRLGGTARFGEEGGDGGGRAANSGLGKGSAAPEPVNEGSCSGSGLVAHGGSAGLKLRQHPPPPAHCPAAVRCPWKQTELRSCSGIWDKGAIQPSSWQIGLFKGKRRKREHSVMDLQKPALYLQK